MADRVLIVIGAMLIISNLYFMFNRIQVILNAPAAPPIIIYPAPEPKCECPDAGGKRWPKFNGWDTDFG